MLWRQLALNLNHFNYLGFRSSSSLHPFTARLAFIMSILLSERQTDDLYVPHNRNLYPLNDRYQSTSPRHKAILDYLYNAGLTKSFEQLKEDTKLVSLISFPTSRNTDTL